MQPQPAVMAELDRSIDRHASALRSLETKRHTRTGIAENGVPIAADQRLAGSANAFREDIISPANPANAHKILAPASHMPDDSIHVLLQFDVGGYSGPPERSRSARLPGCNRARRGRNGKRQIGGMEMRGAERRAARKAATGALTCGHQMQRRARSRSLDHDIDQIDSRPAADSRWPSDTRDHLRLIGVFGQLAPRDVAVAAMISCL